MKEKLVILAGPTAVGKTSLSIKLAKRIGGEIISADSMQVYRGMDIGTAKITKEEQQGIPHFLLDELEPSEEFHIVLFQQKAKRYIQEIYERGHIPILVGGTGFYIQSVLYDIDFSDSRSSVETIETTDNSILFGQAVQMNSLNFRQELEKLAQTNGAEWLHTKLQEVDPESAKQIHPNNKKRVIRALEYYHQTGEPISVHNARERAKTSPYAFCYFVLNQERETLYNRINLRIDQMMEDGLLEEVKRLEKAGCSRDWVSMQGLGYKELLAFLDGECSLEEAIYQIKRNTRHFAKRQLTWFGREPEAIWVKKESFPDEEAILEFMIKQIEERVY